MPQSNSLPAQRAGSAAPRRPSGSRNAARRLPRTILLVGLLLLGLLGPCMG